MMSAAKFRCCMRAFRAEVVASPGEPPRKVSIGRRLDSAGESYPGPLHGREG
jgi:hypothetical protein